MQDLTDALDGTVTAEGTPEGTQVDIEAITQGKDSWVVEATATLGDDKATKRTTDPHWLAKDRDGNPFYGKTNERERHVELMERMTTDMEGELDDLAAEVDFANEPRLLELFADLADDIEPKASEAPYPNPTPDIRSVFSDLDLEAQEVTMDVSWSPNTGTTRRRIRWNSKASRLLQTAVREAGDVVEFLIGIALGDSYAGVDVRDFKNPEHEASWDYKVDGKRENMNWIKDRFRAETCLVPTQDPEGAWSLFVPDVFSVWTDGLTQPGFHVGRGWWHDPPSDEDTVPGWRYHDAGGEMRHVVGMMVLVCMALACGGAGSTDDEPPEAPVDEGAEEDGEDEAEQGEGEGDDGEASYDAAMDAVRTIYDRYQTDDAPTRKDLPLSKDLIRLWKKHRDAVTFDPVIDAQDYDISEIEVERDGDDVVVTFRNFDQDKEIRWVMVEEDGAWVAQDIRSKDWSLQEMLSK